MGVGVGVGVGVSEVNLIICFFTNIIKMLDKNKLLNYTSELTLTHTLPPSLN